MRSIVLGSFFLLLPQAFGFTLLAPSVPLPFNPNSRNVASDGDGIMRRAMKVDSPTTVSSNNSSDGNSNNRGDHLENMSSFSDAYRAWEKYSLTQPYEFWHKSPEAVRESNTTAFFESFIVDYYTKDSRQCKAKGLGELRCFGWVYIGDPNFICNIDTPNMCRKPSSIEIMAHVDKHWGHYTIEERVDLGRQAYFASEIMQTVMAKDYRLYELLKTVETHALTDTAGIVQAFTPQVNGLRVAKCELANVAIQLSLQAVVMAASAAGGAGIGMISDTITQLTELESEIAEQMVKSYKLASKVWANVNTAIGAFWPLYGAGTAITKHLTTGKTYPFRGPPTSANLQEYYKEAAEQEKEFPELVIKMTQSGGMCGNNFGVINDDNVSHISTLTNFVVDYMTLLRARLDRSFRTRFIYQSGVPAESSLAAFMTTANQAVEDIFDQDLKEQEQEIGHSFRQLLASKLLSQSRSYLKCEERDDAAAVCAAHKTPKNPKSNASRFCPSDSNMRCQMARWTNQGLNNHEDFVPALNGGFEKYNMSPLNLMQNSWQKYNDEKTGNMTAWSDMSMQGQIGIPQNQLYLPVCVSKVKTIEEIKEPKMWKAEETGWRTGFPFSCGGFRSEETSTFLRSININPAEEKDLWKTTLAKYLNRIKEPANRYMLLCTLGVRWPLWDRRSHRFDVKDELVLNQHDNQCSAILSETAGMNEWETNFHFCTSDTMRPILKKEHPWLINVVPSPISHKRACGRWLKDNKGRIEVLGKDAKDKYREFLLAAGNETMSVGA